VARKTNGRKNREIALDVLNGKVPEVFLKMCGGKALMIICMESRTQGPFTEFKRSFHTACRMVRIEGLWWRDLRATFWMRLALAGYEALTIMILMGHRI
jgi:hypothetical protein